MIQIDNLRIRRGNFSLKDVSIHVEKGSSLALLGPSGSGKTLLMETILGLRKPDKGQVRINGIDVSSIKPEESSIAYLPQDLALFPHLSVFDNIAFCLRIKGRKQSEIDATVKDLGRHLGIEHLIKRKNVTNLSGGEKQRVALARALAAKPSLVFLDEPFSALDGARRRELHKEVNRLHWEHRFTLLFVTHDLEEAIVVADTVALMRNGAIIQTGKPSKVFNTPQTPWAAHFLLFENILSVKTMSGKMCYGSIEFDVPSTCTSMENNDRDSYKIAIKADSLKMVSNMENAQQRTFTGKAGSTYQYGRRKVTEVYPLDETLPPLLCLAPSKEVKKGCPVDIYYNPENIVFLKDDSEEHGEQQ